MEATRPGLVHTRARVGRSQLAALAAVLALAGCAGVRSTPGASDAAALSRAADVDTATALILQLPEFDWEHHNPAAFARVANALRALGEDACLPALDRASARRPDAVIALTCVLFDPTPNGKPRPTHALPEEPASRAERELRAQHPDYPVVWIAGVPIWGDGLDGFVEVDGTYLLERRPATQDVDVFLAWANEHARLAATPIDLPDNPAAAVSWFWDHDEHIAAWERRRLYVSGPDYLLSLARRHAYTALEGLLAEEVERGIGYPLESEHFIGDPVWDELDAIVVSAGVRWDRASGRYVKRGE